MNVPRCVRTAQLRAEQAAHVVSELAASDDRMPESYYHADLRGFPVIGAGSGATWWTQPHNERAWEALRNPRLQAGS